MTKDECLEAFSSAICTGHFHKVLSILLEMGIQSVSAEEGSLLLYRPVERELEFKIVAGGKSRNLQGKRVPLGEGITGDAALVRETLIGSRNESHKMYDIENDGHPFSVMASPLIVDDDVIGVITAVKFTVNDVFTSRDAYKYDMLSCVFSELIGLRVHAMMMQDFSGIGSRQEPLSSSPVKGAVQLMKRFPGKEDDIANLLCAIEKLLG